MPGTPPPGSRWEQGRTNGRVPAIVAAVLVAVVGLVVVGATAYDAGREAADSAVDCLPGDVLSVRSSRAETDNGQAVDRTLRIGDCEAISDQAFSAAVKALAPRPDEPEKCASNPASTTTTTKATTTTTTAVPGGTPPTTAPACPPL